ncbi:MAG: DUF721 domain-containing protein [Gammaproteobacteria bacterium]|nr:DUF721 domain-containing protein [Gammaproteobacteria bacterium]
MSQGYQQAITHVLQQDSKILGTLLNKLNQLAQINLILAQNLEPKLAPHCKVANFENHCLTVVTNNAIWATQFRFQIPTLQAKLLKHSDFAELRSIVCKIIPVIGQRETPALDQSRIVPKLSLKTAEIILDTAQNIKHDKLRLIMRKIAKNTA